MSSSLSSSTTGGGGTTGAGGGSSNKSAAIATGNALWNKVPKANAELFALTYGALVTEVLRDYGATTNTATSSGGTTANNKDNDNNNDNTNANNSIQQVNEQLENMGHSIGVRCVDEYLAKLSTAAPVCKTFFDTAEVLAKSAFKMFLGITADVVIPPSQQQDNTSSGDDGNSPQPQVYSLYLQDNPLSIFVELPEQYTNKDTIGNNTPMLEYNALYCGIIRGALEMLNMRVECTFIRSTLRGDDVNEIRVELKEVIAEGAGDDYKDE